MKELSIEEKAKAYDEAIERANELNYVSDKDSLQRKTVEHIFPQLKESEEDERIRKALRERIIRYDPNNEILIKEEGISQRQFIAWLEKQGKQNYKIVKGKNYFCVKTHNYAGVEWIKGTKYYASDNYTLVNQGCECYCPEYSKEEGTAYDIAAKSVCPDTLLKKSVSVHESVRRASCQQSHLNERDGHISVSRAVDEIYHRGETG